MGWLGARAMTVSVQKRREIAILSGLGNTGFIGLPLCAALLGFIPPEPIKPVFGTLSKLATPLAMLYIGMLLPHFLKGKRFVSVKLLSVPITFKLLLFPLLSATLLSIFPMDSEISRIALIQVAMPTLTLASILFGRYAADEEMGAMTTLFSTLLAMLSIPVVVYMGSLL